MNILSGITATQLRRAIAIKERIEALDSELNHLLGFPQPSSEPVPTKKGRRRMSAAGRAAIAAGQKARWAKLNGATQASAPNAKRKRKVSAAARRKLAAAARARWKKAKASGQNAL